MSNALTTLVSIFNGSNYLVWADEIEAFFMAQNLWSIVSNDFKDPGNVPSSVSDDTKQAQHEDKQKDWKSRNRKALGTMRLYCYGTPGASTIYADFKAAAKFYISGNSHPAPEINKLTQIIEHLKVDKVDLPELVRAMMLLNAIPQKWEAIPTIVLQQHETTKLTFAVVRDVIITKWEQGGTIGQAANKISAIKRKHPEQTFKQQQQHPFKDKSKDKGGTNKTFIGK
ncbi:hypothetical protein FIBSPDRAFT_1038538 [Athelia psychrophila]|uniref:Retrotransposon Copia-like N-terminal domain-containing protein n=1 Tax=Athelia psychrophila TaxID=1759441 RepID=A0A166T610_9AGAM|nr:hypothetical protein FIBSPDRAFT_1038538 [Fibularhizoctonia sp. CBS 109695]